MKCSELLMRNRSPLDSEPAPATKSATVAPTEKEDQLAEAPTKSVDEENANQKPIEPLGSEADAKGENAPPASDAKSGKKIAEADVKKGKVKKRNTRNSDQFGMEMIVRTIFPRW